MQVETVEMGAVPGEDERDYVGATVLTDPMGNRKLVSLMWAALPNELREIRVRSTERLESAVVPGESPVLRWRVRLGRAGAERILYYQRGRYFMARSESRVWLVG